MGEPTWQTVRGTLTHRCLLHSATNWLWIGDREADAIFIADARWMAHHLIMALRYENFGQARGLIDRAGPHWGGCVDDYLDLDENDQKKVLAKFATSVSSAAKGMTGIFADQEWQYIRSEVDHPAAFLDTTDQAARTRARKRVDLVATRLDQVPLIVDLKCSDTPWTPSRLRNKRIENKDYGDHFAKVWSRPVDFAILGITFGGDVTLGKSSHHQ